MSKEFERENRYIVIKRSDLETLSPIDRDLALSNLEQVFALQDEWDVPKRQCVVVESDWPEYEPTWAAIERRVTGAPAWVGIGPPPSGTVCELRNVAAGSQWAEATIMFASRNVVVWDWVGEPPVNGLCTAYAHAVEMRPIRTPEQIAAEEREKAIEEMVRVDEKGSLSRTYFCELLYDAGYRKQVAP